MSDARAYPWWLPLLLGFLSAIGPLSTDMYLPAFPAIEAEFGLPLGSAQATLAVWFLGLGVGQLTQGTLSDRYGRRTPLLFSTAIFTVASIGCALAPSFNMLVAMRLIAALAASASMVIPTAVVRDLASGHAAATMMSRLILVRGVGPIVAPLIGGLLLTFANWHGIFWFGTVYGVVCWILVAWKVPDTLPVNMRVRHNLSGMLSRYWMILVEPSFQVHTMMSGSAMFALFAFIGGSPGVFIDGMHLTPRAFSVVFSCCAANYILFSQLNPGALTRFGASRVMQVASRVLFVGGALMALISFLGTAVPGWLSWWMLMPPMMMMMATQGFIQPNAAVGSLHRHSAHAGSASALMGMIGFCLGAVSGLLAGVFSDGTPRGMAALMLTGAAMAIFADWRRRVMLARN
jgi:MFS transporter, DHA1 family, multidrug resistance protein